MNKKEDFIIMKGLVWLSIPTILEQLLSTLLQYVDTAMVGRLGEKATAAVSVTTTISWLVGSMASAVSVAVVAMIAKAIGAKQLEKAKIISKQAVIITLIVGIVLGAVSVALSPFIPIWMGAEKSVRANATIYFVIISTPLVFRCASSVLGAAIRATQNTKTPMIITTCSNVINVLFNIVFIYWLGLGVMGAAISTAISYITGGIAMFIMFRKNKYFDWPIKELRLDRGVLNEVTKLGMPVLLTNITSCLGYVFFAGMVSGLGTTIFAAHSIAVTAETCFYIPGYGIRTATSSMIGLAYGEKDRNKFEVICKISIIFTVILMCLNGLILYKVAYPLMSVFTSSQNVARIGADMLKLVAFSEPFFGLMVVSEGIMYGLGKTGYAFWVETGCMWGIRIMFTFLCVKMWNMGLTEVWYCMIADNVCKAILLTIPVVSRRLRLKMIDN